MWKSGFPDSSVGKESACKAWDPSLIPELERSAWEGIGYMLQYSGASFVAQLVKNSPVMRETSVPRNFSPKRCPFHYRGLECKSRKSRNTWSNRQIWPWNPRLINSIACMTPPFGLLKESHNQQVKWTWLSSFPAYLPTGLYLGNLITFVLSLSNHQVLTDLSANLSWNYLFSSSATSVVQVLFLAFLHPQSHC